ncbi:MAG: hypothetical protein OIF36_03855 [Alphaproteobacteria bacterium]|nr:hypothetical protein [Alphaproteobacteria bacterium]
MTKTVENGEEKTIAERGKNTRFSSENQPSSDSKKKGWVKKKLKDGLEDVILQRLSKTYIGENGKEVRVVDDIADIFFEELEAKKDIKGFKMLLDIEKRNAESQIYFNGEIVERSNVITEIGEILKAVKRGELSIEEASELMDVYKVAYKLQEKKLKDDPVSSFMAAVL